jgi:crotonobetainyl-CoA:carnitine CoA-transferase CaiB-like acyl-CoA transferase
VVLDLTTEEGKEALFRIVGTADVLVHNFRPRVMEKLGVQYEQLSEKFPNLIYCAAYGFRKEGPRANNPAYDDIIQAASGLADLQTVTSDQPRYVPTIMADKTSSFNVVSGILAALYAREKGAGGQAIEVPMFESLVDFAMVEHLFGANFEPPIDQMGYQRILNTMRKPYATKDGYLAVLPYTDQNWKDFFDVAGRDDLKDDPRFVDHGTRVKHSQEIYGILEEVVATRTTDEWESALTAANIPVQRVLTKEDLLNDKQLEASGFWHLEDHPTEGKIRLTDPPVRFSGTPSAIRRLPPQLGEHNAEVLKEAGYTDAEIAALPFGK